MGSADEGYRPDGLDDRAAVRNRLRKARPQQAPRETDDRSFRQAEAERTAIEFVLKAIGLCNRHCERSEAIHVVTEQWIASSLTLPCANASRLSQAMTDGRVA